MTAVTLGQPLTLIDMADLELGVNPTGTITFTLVGPDGTTVDTEHVMVNQGNGTYTTPTGFIPGVTQPVGPTLVGTYQWDATYSGDANNNGVNDISNPAEQVTVNKDTPTFSTTPNVTAVTLGQPLFDIAHLELGFNPTGTITFTLELGGTTVDAKHVMVNQGNGTYLTPTGFTPTVVGTYQWDATYSGDANNNGVNDIGDPAEQVTVICFMPSTLISTPDGDQPVEMFKPGDLVTTSEGVAVPVRWVGRQTVSRVFGDPLRVLPIRIRAGALGDNVPVRDLLLSPDHAVLVDIVLVQAGALVNGVSILRERNVPERFTYYHIELDDHSLLLAEGVPAETFVDNVDRLAFDNWAEHEALYPQGKPIVEMDYPRAKAYRQVPQAIRERLASRAVAQWRDAAVA